jgi:hypothetical protein
MVLHHNESKLKACVLASRRQYLLTWVATR